MAKPASSSMGGDETKIASLLQTLGVSRIESLSIVSLLDGKPRTSREIEKVAGLHQPEVSVAMRPLYE